MSGALRDIEAINDHFLRCGWVVVEMSSTDLVLQMREEVLAFLKREVSAEISSLEEYHRFVDEDERHGVIQHKLAELYWRDGWVRKLLEAQLPLLKKFFGVDLHAQRFPYLRIARPGKPQDNINFHRDTHYGASPYESSILIPFVELNELNALRVISGSHVESEASYPAERLESETVERGSVKHQLGFPYAPQRLKFDVAERTTPVPLKLGEMLILSQSAVHGQRVNASDYTRFSSDIRIVNSLAPIQWERSVKKDFYDVLCRSAVLRQADEYYIANAAAKSDA